MFRSKTIIHIETNNTQPLHSQPSEPSLTFYITKTEAVAMIGHTKRAAACTWFFWAVYANRDLIAIASWDSDVFLLKSLTDSPAAACCLAAASAARICVMSPSSPESCGGGPFFAIARSSSGPMVAKAKMCSIASIVATDLDTIMQKRYSNKCDVSCFLLSRTEVQQNGAVGISLPFPQFSAGWGGLVPSAE